MMRVFYKGREITVSLVKTAEYEEDHEGVCEDDHASMSLHSRPFERKYFLWVYSITAFRCHSSFLHLSSLSKRDV